MSHTKLRGFIVREIPVGEADRIISIFCAELGLISAVARGSRRTKSRLLAATQIFTLNDFELFNYKGKYTVDDTQIVESFARLREDIDRLICASHLAEVLLDCMRDGVAEPEIYKLWAYSLSAIQEHSDPLLVVHAAQLRLLSEIGFALHLDSCVSCGKVTAALNSQDNNSARSVFSISACGIICGKTSCHRNDRRLISRAVLDCLAYCQNVPVQRLFNFSLSKTVRDEFLQLSADYLVSQMEKNYTRLKMLADLSAFSLDPRNHAADPSSHLYPEPDEDAIGQETADDKPADHSGHQSGE